MFEGLNNHQKIQSTKYTLSNNITWSYYFCTDNVFKNNFLTLFWCILSQWLKLSSSSFPSFNTAWPVLSITLEIKGLTEIWNNIWMIYPPSKKAKDTFLTLQHGQCNQYSVHGNKNVHVYTEITWMKSTICGVVSANFYLLIITLN
jgi:hypothetical protein